MKIETHTGTRKQKYVLIVSSVASMIEQFNMSNIKILQGLGFDVEVACNFKKGNTISKEKAIDFQKKMQKSGITYYQIDFSRNVFNLCQNIKAYIQLADILKNKKYELIHCHSPIGGVIGRLAAYKYRIKVIYTAHGFHFYKGAPIKNWLLFYPIERILAKRTELLITINKEDYKRAKRFTSGRIKYVPGVGIDLEKFGKHILTKEERWESRVKWMTSPKDILLLSIGELNKNKNHQIVIRALSRLPSLPITYIICGIGPYESDLKNLVKQLQLQDKVLFLGYQNNVSEFYNMSDIFILPSKREGLSVALMEAMASGLPVICSNIRGNTDLVRNGYNGLLCSNIEDYINAIEQLSKNHMEREYYSRNCKRMINHFSANRVNSIMTAIYKTILCNHL